MGSVNYGELAKTTGKAFESLPVGTYNVEVTGAEVKTAKSGNTYYHLELTVEDGPAKGKKVWTNVTLNGENPGTFFGQLRSLGLDAAHFAQFPEIDEDDTEGHAAVHDVTAAALIGKRAIAPVKQGKPYEGQPRTEVGFFKSQTSAASNSSVPTIPGTAPTAPIAPTAPAVPTVPVVPAAPVVAATPPVAVPAAPVVEAAPPAPVVEAAPVAAAPPGLPPGLEG